MTRAGFTLPGVDVDEYQVRYNSGEHFSPNSFFFYINLLLVMKIINLLNIILISCLALELIEHLRAMGETNALVNRIKVRSIYLFVFGILCLIFLFLDFFVVVEEGDSCGHSSCL